jgi:hypothetical protein
MKNMDLLCILFLSISPWVSSAIYSLCFLRLTWWKGLLRAKGIILNQDRVDQAPGPTVPRISSPGIPVNTVAVQGTHTEDHDDLYSVKDDIKEIKASLLQILVCDF